MVHDLEHGYISDREMAPWLRTCGLSRFQRIGLTVLILVLALVTLFSSGQNYGQVDFVRPDPNPTSESFVKGDLSHIIDADFLTETEKMFADHQEVGDLDPWSETQFQRRKLIHSACSGLNVDVSMDPEDLFLDSDNIIVSPKHHVLYCAIPKNACSSWKSVLVSLAGNSSLYKPTQSIHSPKYLASLGLPPLSLLSSHGIQNVLSKFTKFLVVRHPLERLLSAYRDKFKTYNHWTRHFQHKYGRQIIRLYRGKEASNESLYHGHDVSFREFLQFITDRRVNVNFRNNPHWDTYYNLCKPCHVGYDHVIKFESLHVDNSQILKTYFGVQNASAFFPKKNSKHTSTNQLMTRYYSTVPDNIMDKIYQIFKPDFEMFGYEFD